MWKVWHLYLLDELFHSSSYACSELKPLFWEVFGEALVTASKATPIGEDDLKQNMRVGGN